MKLPEHQESMLTDDQEQVCTRLVTLAHVRTITTETALPVGVLPRWSIPLLVGPAGVGKTYVCEEVGRRWGGKPCQRWDVSAWSLMNRGSHATRVQISNFIDAHTDGCIVYLAGIDALATTDYSAAYYQIVGCEIARLLDEAAERAVLRSSGQDNKLFRSNVLMVVGGCFATLWGDATFGGPSGGDAWRLADREPLANGPAVGKWLLEHSALPVDILRRLSSEPLLLRPMDSGQADRLASRLYDRLPPSLDGLSKDDLSAALRSPSGWRAATGLIERAWVDGHEHLPILDAIPPVAPKPKLFPSLPLPAIPPVNLRPIRLGARLGIRWAGSALQRKTRRLELPTAWHLEWLAVARGFTLPGETYDTDVRENVSRHKLSDVELAAALLSPFIEACESAVCRGASMLGALINVADPESIARESRNAGGEVVVRHVAQIGHALQQEQRRWHDLLLRLPAIAAVPSLPRRIMPDETIRAVLSIVQL